MFSRCRALSNIKSLENWKVSNAINFSYMFSECNSLSDIKPLEIGKFQMLLILVICSVNASHYQILNH